MVAVLGSKLINIVRGEPSNSEISGYYHAFVCFFLIRLARDSTRVDMFVMSNELNLIVICQSLSMGL
jgi:hypothetical protein